MKTIKGTIVAGSNDLDMSREWRKNKVFEKFYKLQSKAEDYKGDSI